MSAPQCYAYSKKGLRCTDIAGHEGQHSHTIQWTDSELWEPGFSLPAPEAVPAMIEIKNDIEDDDDLGDDGTKTPERCFMCRHPWHEDECERLTEGIPCGCTTAVA